MESTPPPVALAANPASVEPLKNPQSEVEAKQCEKLQLEIIELRRRFWQTPTFWFSLATGIAAVVGIVFQSQKSSLDRQEAEIKLAHAQFDVKKAEDELAKLRKAGESQTDENKQLIQTKGELETKIAGLHNTIAGLGTTVAALKKETSQQAGVIAKQSEDIDALVATLLVSVQERNRVVAKFNTIVRPLLENGGDVVVVAHSWGSVVAYLGLLELSKSEKQGKVLFFTVGTPLSIGAVRLSLKAVADFGTKPRIVREWINLDAQGDIVGGPLKNRLPVDEEYVGLAAVGCGSLLGVTNPSCAQGSYFDEGNTAVHRDIFAKHIIAAFDPKTCHLVYVHRAGTHAAGYSDAWFTSLRPFVAIGEENRHEVLWELASP